MFFVSGSVSTWDSKRQRGRVDPLQIVHDDAQQLIARRDGLYQLGKHTVEAVARLDRRQAPNRRLRSRDQLQLGKTVDDHAGIVADRRQDARSPPFEFVLGPAEQLTDQLLEGLHQSQIGNIALVLIELAGDEASVAVSDKVLELPQQRRLANPGSAFDQKQRRRPALSGLGFLHQDRRFAVAPVELTRDAQHPFGIVAAGLEIADGAGGPPERAALAEIGDEAR